jgi:hypothetical protein
VLALALGLAPVVVAAGCGAPEPPIPATFSSINQRLFQVGCNFTSCHDASAGHDQGSLDLATDPYRALLGADGLGAPAQNIKGTATGMLRVKPGDPEHSLPETAPGSVHQNALNAVYQWIAAGAPND